MEKVFEIGYFLSFFFLCYMLHKAIHINMHPKIQNQSSINGIDLNIHVSKMHTCALGIHQCN